MPTEPDTKGVPTEIEADIFMDFAFSSTEDPANVELACDA